MPKYIRSETPYWKDLCDDIDNPLIEEIVVFKSAQIGLTRLIGAIFGFWGDTTSDSIMFGLPTDEKAHHEQRNKFQPWLEEVNDLVRSTRKMEFKFCRGGKLFFRSFEKSKALKSDSCRFVVGDEVDEAPDNVEGEGDPLRMMEARQIAQRNAKRLYGSTPKDRAGHIARRDEAAGDKREMWVNCPHCRTPQKLAWERLRWAKVEGATHKELASIIAVTPGMVWYDCLAGCRITEAERWPMIAAGRWCSQKERKDNQDNIIITQVQRLDEFGVVHGARPISTTVTYRPWSIISSWFGWSKLVKVWLENVDDPTNRKTVLSQYMGRLPVVQEIKTTSVDGLTITQQEAKKATGKPGVVPRWAGIVVEGVDCQGDRYYWTRRAYGRVRSRLIAKGVCATLAEVRAHLDLAFPIEGTDQTMMLAGQAIDYGGAEDKNKVSAKERIFKYAGADPRIMPAKGHGNDSRDDYKVSQDETFRREYMAVQSIRTADRIFELRRAGEWEVYAGVDETYIESMDSVVPTRSEAGELGYKYGDRCDYFDSEVYSYSYSKHLTAKKPIPEEAVLERLRTQTHTPKPGQQLQTIGQALAQVHKPLKKKW